jgi:site-specific DNA recombinase
MKKAVLYARVSSEIQKTEHTIDSQIIELKKQVAENGDILVREYIDEGYSGTRLHRPALDQLREDLATDLFDIVYFLTNDRIARDVVYQNIIVTEILKHKKELIINGKDYIHNPENKFELTILGAVSELERAKIIERSTRGRLHRLRQGYLVGSGHNIYGYRYTRRSGDSPALLSIYKTEASVVRNIFDMYVQGSSWSTILRSLEEKGTLTRTGKTNWTIHTLRTILKNHTYCGMKYFNTRSLLKQPTDSIRTIKYGKKIYRDKSEWIGVPVPAIVSKEIFEKAQKRFAHNKDQYRNPHQTQLLSGLIRCGDCGKFFISYQRYYRNYYTYKGVTKITENIHHKTAYKCNGRHLDRVHLRDHQARCRNPEVSVKKIDPLIFEIIKDNMLDPDTLIKWVEKTSDATIASQKSIEKQLKDMELNIFKISDTKRLIVNDYVSGKIDRNTYVEKSQLCDSEISDIETERDLLVSKIPTIHKRDIVGISIRRYCEEVKSQLEQCLDYSTKREFLLEHIECIVIAKEKIAINGSIPLQANSNDLSRIKFSINSNLFSKQKPN